jgi:hypothetical protein
MGRGRLLAKSRKTPSPRPAWPLACAKTADVNLSPGRAIPTGLEIASPFVLRHLRDGTPFALAKSDEVARNGVLQRITSARGFL